MSSSYALKFASALTTIMLLLALPANALTFNWSFVTTGDSDNPGQTVSGLIWGLQEGFNNGSDVHATVTSTPTGDLVGGIWDFYETTPPFGIAFVVTDGDLSYANAGFTLGGASPFGAPQLMFSINNDADDYSFP